MFQTPDYGDLRHHQFTKYTALLAIAKDRKAIKFYFDELLRIINQVNHEYTEPVQISISNNFIPLPAPVKNTFQSILN